MPATYEPIATSTLSTTSGGITFSNIPATYTDLRIVCIAIQAAGGNFGVRVNGDSSSIYYRQDLIASGTAASGYSPGAAGQAYFVVDNAIGGLTATPQLYTIDLFQYASSTVKKTVLITANEDRNGSGYVSHQVGLWNSTAAITSIFCFNSTDLTAGTTATLYGIKAA